MYLEVGGVKFKDSLNFLPMALSALPKAFDIENEEKGIFILYSTETGNNLDRKSVV